MFDRIDALLELMSALLKYAAALLLLGVAVLIAFDVGLRVLFNWPIIGIAEIVANGIVIIAYLQLSYAVRIGAMLRSELLINFLPGRTKLMLETVVACLGVLLFALIAWASYAPMMRAISTSEFEGHASFQIPTWPVRVVIVTCSILAIANYLSVAYRALFRGEVTSNQGELASQSIAK